MKKISIAFRRAGCDTGEPLAVVTGFFEVLPGEGRIEWRGDLEPHVGAVYAGVTKLTKHYAEMFQKAMEGIAAHSGLCVEVSEEGDWMVCTDCVVVDAPIMRANTRSSSGSSVERPGTRGG